MTDIQSHADQHRLAWEHRNRRRFFLKLLGLGAAGLTVGGGAAWANNQMTQDQAALTALNTQLTDTTAAHTALEVSYTTLQGQNTELSAQLTSLSGQNAQLASALSAAQQEATDLRAQIAALQTDLAASQTKVTKQQGLVQLYEQLDQFGLDNLLSGGLSTLSANLQGLNSPAELLRAGLKQGRAVLQDFTAALVDIAAAMGWLGEKVVLFKVGLWLIENKAQQTAGAALTGIASVFGGFMGFVLDHLPFNIGTQVRETLAATQNLLTTLSTVADETDDQVMLKISPYVTDSAKSWQSTLVTPLQEDTLTAADQMLDAVAGASATVEKDVVVPTQVVLEQRRVMRERIALYRATEQV